MSISLLFSSPPPPKAFRKEFYAEVPEIARMAETEMHQLRFENDNIKVRGRDCPRPIKTWAQCGFSHKMMELLKVFKYESPTPVQMQALPVIMSGRDMLGIAKTGSGKTLAFLLPLFRHVTAQRPCRPGEVRVGVGGGGEGSTVLTRFSPPHPSPPSPTHPTPLPIP